MKNNEKIMVGILAVVAIILIIVMVIVRNNRKVEIPSDGNALKQAEELISVLDDGTRVNTSAKLHETKNFEGMEISNLQLTEKGNLSQILATVKNTSNSVKGGFAVKIKFVDKDGKEIKTVHGIIKELQPGEETQLNTSATFDYANAYDFIISKNQ